MGRDDEVGVRLSVKDRVRYVREIKAAEQSHDDLGDSVDRAAGKAERSTGKWKKWGAAAGVAVGAAAVAVGGLAVKGVSAAIEFETGMREVFTLLPGISAAAMGRMEADVKSFATATGVLPDESIPALYNALSAGVPKKNVFTFLETANKAAVGGATDLETAVDGISTVINAFGLKASEAESVADSMFTAVKGGKTTFGELSASLFNVAPAAAAAGVSIEEVNAGIATLTAGGTPTSVATTQLRAALTGLQKPSKELDKIFQKLGYDNAQLAVEQKGLGFALKAVKDASGGSNGELQKLLGSTEAVAAANVIAGTGAAKFKDEMKAQRNAAGAVGEAFDTMDAGLGQSVKRIRAVGEMAVLSFGQKLAPHAEKVADWLEVHLPRAGEYLETALGFVRDKVDLVTDAFDFMGDKVSDATDWVDEHSTGLTVAASIMGVVMLPALVNLVVQMGVATVAWGVNTAATIANTAAMIASTVARSAWTVVGWAVVAVTSAMTVAGWAATAMSGAWTAAQWLLNAALTANPIGLVVVAIAALVAGFVIAYNKSETFRNAVTAMWGALKSGATSAVNFVIGMLNTLIGGFNAAIRLANKLPGVNIPEIGQIGTVGAASTTGVASTAGGVQERASGGLVRAGTVLVGERGPELLHLGARHAPSWITDAVRTGRAVGGDGAAMGGDIIFERGAFQITGVSDPELAARLAAKKVAKAVADRQADKYGPGD